MQQLAFVITVALWAQCALLGCVSSHKPHFWRPRGAQSMRLRGNFTSKHIKDEDDTFLSGDFIVQVPVNAPPSQPPGLLLYFHGDGAAFKGWDQKDTLDRLAETGETYNLITVALREPHEANWWEGEVDENVKFIQEFIADYLLPRFAFEQRHVFFSGVSGGADFAGGIFPLATGYHFQGAAIVTCGGDLPERMITLPSTRVDPAHVQGFRYYFANVEDDPDFPPQLVDQTVTYFKGLGFQVRREVAGHESLQGTRSYGQGHCSFDTAGWRDRFLSEYFAAEQHPSK